MSFATWAPRAVELGAYLHIPFCTQRCGYCSFNTAPDAPGAVARFVPALLGEIGLAATAPWAAAIHRKSVFLGGGTPSLLPPEAMAAILDRLRAHFPLEPPAEITVECNPESVSVERLAGYRHAGVTRISLGVQSLDDRILPTLDRLHTAAQARFEHYEVSNYARPGHRSAHNQIYWRAEEYLGFGPGACGYLGDVRYANVKPVDRWAAMIADGLAPVDSHETLTPRQRMAERLMLGLRMREGVPARWMEERVAVDGARLRGVLAAWTERGLLVTEGGRARLTEPGFLLSDALFMELL